jgi:hypothetical protein
MSVSLVSSVSKGWLHDNGGFVFGERYYLDPLYRREIDIKIDQFLRQKFPDYALYNLESNLVQVDYWQPDYLYVGGIQPNLIIGICVGAEMAWYEDKDIDFVDINPLGHITSVAELPSPEAILAHPFLQNFDRQIAELQQTHPHLTVIPPFFWDTSGRTSLHGFVTTSMKFYGQAIFLKMFEDPQFVLDFHDWLADVNIAIVKHYSDLVNMPVTSVHVGECVGTMIRDSQYTQFVLPFINKVADALGPLRLHSCGRSNHLLPVFRDVHDLQVLDTGSDTSVAAIRSQLGPDLKLDIAPPLEVLDEHAPQEAMQAWLDTTLLENDEGPLQIGYHLEPGYSLQNCLLVHDYLSRKGLITKERK